MPRRIGSMLKTVGDRRQDRSSDSHTTMSTPVPSPTWDCTKSPRWQALIDSARSGRSIKQLFAADAQRFEKCASMFPQCFFVTLRPDSLALPASSCSTSPRTRWTTLRWTICLRCSKRPTLRRKSRGTAAAAALPLQTFPSDYLPASPSDYSCILTPPAATGTPCSPAPRSTSRRAALCSTLRCATATAVPSSSTASTRQAT
jgi:hypothetical protein